MKENAEERRKVLNVGKVCGRGHCTLKMNWMFVFKCLKKKACRKERLFRNVFPFLFLM